MDDYEDIFGDRDDRDRPAGRPWYLLTGLVLGLILGLLVTRLVAPIRYYDTTPASLLPAAQAEYRLRVAHAFAAAGNLGRAAQRISLLGEEEPLSALQAQLESLTDSELPALADVNALTLLLSALSGGPSNGGAAVPEPSQQNPAVSLLISPTAQNTAPPTATLDPASAIRTLTPTFTPQPTLTPTVTHTPLSTFTPRPTATTRATLPATYHLISRQAVCDPALPEGLLQVIVLDERSRPLPGVAVHVRWEDRTETFYTGLYSEISPGYADFRMDPGVTYTLSVGQGGETVTDLAIGDCAAPNGVTYQGGWLVQFQQ